MKTGLRTAAVLFLVVVVFLTCSMLPTSMTDLLNGNSGETVTISRQEYEQLVEIAKKYEEVEELRQIVDLYYYQEPDEQAMLDGAADGLLSGLDDPYTYFYTPEDFAKMWEDDEGEYAGVGMQITANYATGICTISRVFLNSPALEAGIKKGDILVRVEDLEVTATNLQDAVDIMRGEVGKPVNIRMLRGDQMLDFTVTRAVVHVNYVNSCMLDGDVGYILLYEFKSNCSDDFRIHLDNLIAAGAKSIILDLRDNPGGWTDEANKVADLFLPEGLVTTLKYRDGSEDTYNTTTDNQECELPLIVLINENSASSSELLTGCLQDRGRATVVGVTSYGKGIVQWVLGIGERGAGMQLTIAQYFTPNGHEVHKIGITPDVTFEMPEGSETMFEIGDLNDAQLAEAYRIALEQIQ